jgi:hypothetical protein
VSQLVTSVAVEGNGHVMAGTGACRELVRRDGPAALGAMAAGAVRRDRRPGELFTTLDEEVARQIDDLADELAGETGQDNSYVARVGQLVAARVIAEEIILPQRVLPQAELAADDEPGDQEDVEPKRGERSVVVDRGHPS